MRETPEQFWALMRAHRFAQAERMVLAADQLGVRTDPPPIGDGDCAYLVGYRCAVRGEGRTYKNLIALTGTPPA